jgi:hypothetical protein
VVVRKESVLKLSTGYPEKGVQSPKCEKHQSAIKLTLRNLGRSLNLEFLLKISISGLKTCKFYSKFPLVYNNFQQKSQVNEKIDLY